MAMSRAPAWTGIYAGIRLGTDLSVTTGAGTNVTGCKNGIVARNYGSGRALHHRQWRCRGHQLYRHLCAQFNGTDLTVTTGAGTAVTGLYYGIRACNYGSGALTVTANGDVEGTNVFGIFARNSNYGTDLSVTTGPTPPSPATITAFLPATKAAAL